MRNTLIYIILLLVTLSCSEQTPINSNDKLTGTINISGAFALYPIVVKWSEEFKKIHPNVRFNVSAGGAGKGISDALVGLADIGMVSRDLNESEIKKGAFTIAVTKDAVVPVINSNNPNKNEILKKGISQLEFKSIFIDEKIKNWTELGFSIPLPLHAYSRSDASGAAESWAKYLGFKQEDLLGIGVFGDPGLLQAVKKDIRSIGYNNIGFAYHIKSRLPNKGIIVVPIDINNNGKIDDYENFYQNLNSISKAIENGVFPSPPARDLYFITKGKPTNPTVIEFTKWVLSEGQKYVSTSGYVKLTNEKLKNELIKITN